MASGFGGGSFSTIKGPSQKGPSGIRPGGFGNFGNTNFHGGPVQAKQSGPSSADMAKWVFVGTANANAAKAAPPAPPAYPSPYDSQYFVQLAQANNAANQKIAAYNADISNGQTNLNSTLAQLAHNQTLAQQKAQLAENARGGFAQGFLGQTEGQIAQQYLTQQQNLQTKYAQNKAAWEQAIAGVQQGLPLEQIALGLASAARQSALGLQAPDSTPPAAPAAPAATPASSSKAPAAPPPKLPKKGQKAGIAPGGFGFNG